MGSAERRWQARQARQARPEPSLPRRRQGTTTDRNRISPATVRSSAAAASASRKVSTPGITLRRALNSRVPCESRPSPEPHPRTPPCRGSWRRHRSRGHRHGRTVTPGGRARLHPGPRRGRPGVGVPQRVVCGDPGTRRGAASTHYRNSSLWLTGQTVTGVPAGADSLDPADHLVTRDPRVRDSGRFYRRWWRRCDRPHRPRRRPGPCRDRGPAGSARRVQRPQRGWEPRPCVSSRSRRTSLSTGTRHGNRPRRNNGLRSRRRRRRPRRVRRRRRTVR